jgi:hypothetical protein
LYFITFGRRIQAVRENILPPFATLTRGKIFPRLAYTSKNGLSPEAQKARPQALKKQEKSMHLLSLVNRYVNVACWLIQT